MEPWVYPVLGIVVNLLGVASIKRDLKAIKKHLGIEVVNGKVIELRAVKGAEYTAPEAK